MAQNGHFGPKWLKMAILAHFGPFIPGFDDVLGPKWPYGPKWPFWPILAPNHHFGPFGRYMGLYRGFKGVFGPFWAILAQNDQKSPFLAYFGSFWGAQMAQIPLKIGLFIGVFGPSGSKWLKMAKNGQK